MTTLPILVSLCAAIMLSACSTPKTSSYNTNLFTIVDTSTSLDKAQMKIYIASAASKLLLLEQRPSKQCISGQLAIAQTDPVSFIRNLPQDKSIILDEIQRLPDIFVAIKQAIDEHRVIGSSDDVAHQKCSFQSVDSRPPSIFFHNQ